MLLYVHRNCRLIRDGSQPAYGHLDFLWATDSELKMSTETVGLLGTGAQDGHLDFHTAPELWASEL